MINVPRLHFGFIFSYICSSEWTTVDGCRRKGLEETVMRVPSPHKHGPPCDLLLVVFALITGWGNVHQVPLNSLLFGGEAVGPLTSVMGS